MPINQDDGATRYWVAAYALIDQGLITLELAKGIALQHKPGGRPLYWDSKLAKLKAAAADKPLPKPRPWQEIAAGYGIADLDSWTAWQDLRAGATAATIRKHLGSKERVMAALDTLEDLGLITIVRSPRGIKEVTIAERGTAAADRTDHPVVAGSLPAG